MLEAEGAEETEREQEKLGLRGLLRNGCLCESKLGASDSGFWLHAWLAVPRGMTPKKYLMLRKQMRTDRIFMKVFVWEL